jgi:Protein of unknown function (DUF1559)
MAIRFACSCGQPIAARKEYAGRRVKCIACQKVLTIPGERLPPTSGPAPKAPPAPPVAPSVAPPVQSDLPPTLPPSSPPARGPDLPPTLPPTIAPRTAGPALAQPPGSTVIRPPGAGPTTMAGPPPGVPFRCLCGGEFTARPKDAGKPARCSFCNDVLFIPTPATIARAGGQPVVATRDGARRYTPGREGLSPLARAGVVLLVLLLLGGAAYAAWEFHFKEAAARARKSRGDTALALVPGDAVGFVSYRLADVWNSEQVRMIPPEVMGQITVLENKVGLKIGDVERVVAVFPSAEDQQSLWVAVETTKDIDQEKLKTALRATEESSLQGVTYFKSPGLQSTSIHFVHNKLLVIAPAREGMEAYVNGKPGQAGSPLFRGLSAAAGKATAVLAFHPPAPFMQRLGASLPPALAEFQGLLDFQTITMTTEDEGTKETLQLWADFATANRATAAARTVRKLVAKGKKELKTVKAQIPESAYNQIVTLLDQVKVEHQGPSLRVGLQYDEAMLIGALLPAVQKVREAASRAQASNNFKQIALAFQNHSDTMRRLPGPIRDPRTGRPLLSWRVAILPYIEQQELYQQFRLNEPWNSQANRRLIPLMPRIFDLPGAPTFPGQTYIQVFTGPGTLYTGKEKPPLLAGIPDGTSRTLMIAEARNSVGWTAPVDMVLTNQTSPRSLVGNHYGKGTLIAFLDGVVRFLPLTLDDKTWRALISPSGGEVIPKLP